LGTPGPVLLEGAAAAAARGDGPVGEAAQRRLDFVERALQVAALAMHLNHQEPRRRGFRSDLERAAQRPLRFVERPPFNVETREGKVNPHVAGIVAQELLVRLLHFRKSAPLEGGDLQPLQDQMGPLRMRRGESPPEKDGALGVSGLKRSSGVPDIPTAAEQGLPGFEVNSWYGVFVPARTPKPIAVQIHGRINAVLAMQDVKDKLAAQGVEVSGSTPEQLTAIIQNEKKVWSKVVKQANIKVE